MDALNIFSSLVRLVPSFYKSCEKMTSSKLPGGQLKIIPWRSENNTYVHEILPAVEFWGCRTIQIILCWRILNKLFYFEKKNVICLGAYSWEKKIPHMKQYSFSRNAWITCSIFSTKKSQSIRVFTKKLQFAIQCQQKKFLRESELFIRQVWELYELLEFSRIVLIKLVFYRALLILKIIM